MNDFLGSSRLQPDRHPDGRPTMLPPSASDYLEGPAPLAPQKTLLPLPGSQSTGAAPGSNDADQPQFYAGPHQAGKYGGIYPPAGDSKLDVDLDGTTRQAIFGSPDWAKEPGKDMRYYQDDTQYHGTGDPFGFF